MYERGGHDTEHAFRVSTGQAPGAVQYSTVLTVHGGEGGGRGQRKGHLSKQRAEIVLR